MAPPTPIHKGVRYTFFIQNPFSDNDRLRSMHYTRVEFDPASNKDVSLKRPHELNVLEETSHLVDCKMCEDVTALVGSGDDDAKNMAEVVQNAVDTTLDHNGVQQTGGWGDGFKVAVARALRDGASLCVVTVDDVDCFPFTSLTTEGFALYAQNAHPYRKFRDESVYLGHSSKPKKTAQQQGDMVKQMCIVANPAMIVDTFFEPLPTWKTRGGRCDLTSVCLEYKRDVISPVPSLHRPWFGLYVKYLETCGSVRQYSVFDTYHLSMRVFICQHTQMSPKQLRVTTYQNGIFIAGESYADLTPVTERDMRKRSRAGDSGVSETMFDLQESFYGDIVVLVTSNVSISPSRDRNLDWWKLSDCYSCTSLFDNDQCAAFVRDVLFNKSIMYTLWQIVPAAPKTRADLCKPKPPVLAFFEMFINAFKEDMRPFWDTRHIPVPSLEDAREFVNLFETTQFKLFLAPKFYNPFYNKTDIMPLHDVDRYGVEETVMAFAQRCIEMANDLHVYEKLKAPRVYVLPCTAAQCKRLHDNFVFTEQGAIVCRQTHACSHSDNIFIPKDFHVEMRIVQNIMQTLQMVKSEHVQALWSSKMLQDEAIAELSKKAGVARATESNDKHVSPSDELPRSVCFDARRATFGPGEGKRVRGQGSIDFSPFAIVPKGTGSFELKIASESALVPKTCRQADTMRLEDVAREGAPLRRPGTRDPNTVEWIEELLPNVLAFISNVSYKFVDPSSKVPWHATKEAVRLVCYAVGHCGYVESHDGGIDNPLGGLNCLSASLRFALLLKWLGYTTFVCQNQRHAFVFVHALMHGAPYTLVECTVTSPGPIHVIADALPKKLLSNTQAEPMRSKKKARHGTTLECFCNRTLPPLSFDDRTANCAQCGRLFHVACADDRVEADGTRVCLVCVPDKNGCPCGTLRHFDSDGPKWIGCDVCPRWLHIECCPSHKEGDTTYRCANDGYACLPCDDVSETTSTEAVDESCTAAGSPPGTPRLDVECLLPCDDVVEATDTGESTGVATAPTPVAPHLVGNCLLPAN